MNRAQNTARLSGFSLLEVLTVMALLTLLLAVGNWRPVGPSPGTVTRHFMALCQKARATALASGLPVRVVLCVDPAGKELYLRSATYLVDADGDPSTTGWTRAEPPTVFPEGVFFWQEYSSTQRTMTCELENPTGSWLKVQCVYLEFDALGETAQSGDQFVFVEGQATPLQRTLRNPNNREGVLVRRSGAVSLFRGPEQIQPVPAS
jgi:prepilin-type N-terminal cleavage/methylation domain-containing protein